MLFLTHFCISVTVQHLFSVLSLLEMSSATPMALSVASKETQEAQKAQEAEEGGEAEAA